jgi:hypothetical protein
VVHSKKFYVSYIFNRSSVIIALTILTSCGKRSQKEENKSILYTVDVNFLKECEIGIEGDCTPLTITRQSIKDSINVIYPSAGTQTDIYLYGEKEYERTANGIKTDQPVALRHVKKFGGNSKLQLDITGLPDGTYRSQLIACDFGSEFQLKVRTVKKVN